MYEMKENHSEFMGNWLPNCGGKKWTILFVSTLRRRLSIVRVNANKKSEETTNISRTASFRMNNLLDRGLSEEGVLPLVLKRGWKIHENPPFIDDLPLQTSIYSGLSMDFPLFFHGHL